jgi:hypothetical protein
VGEVAHQPREAGAAKCEAAGYGLLFGAFPAIRMTGHRQGNAVTDICQTRRQSQSTR